jgi:hypothetical protein
VTEQEWDDLKDRELDDSLASLFRSVDAPQPLPGFASRTMKAVRREPLPAGRRPLRHPLIVPLGWAALVAAASIAAWSLVTHPVATELFTSILALAVRAGFGLLHFATTGAALSEPFTALSHGLMRAVATTEGSTALLLIAAMGALSLSALHRLLETHSDQARLHTR